MALSLFRETNSFSACQEDVCILCTPNVHYRVYKNPSLVSTLNCGSHCCSLTSSFFKIHFNSILPSTPWSSKRSLSFTSPHQNPYSFIFSMRAIYRAHLILLDFITLIIFSEQHESCSRFQWPRGLRHGSTAPRFLGLPVRIPPERHIYSL
jgi:hypothetical protein